MDWTPEKIAALTLQEVRNLLENAERKKDSQVQELCKKEIEKRKHVPRVTVKNYVRKTGNPASKRLETEVAEQLEALAMELLGKFDFSTEKARLLSLDSKSFQPHKLLSSKGKAKLGGHQRNGRIAIDRYISYRLKDQTYALIGLLIDGNDPQDLRYQIFGPPEILTNFKTINELRPYLQDGEKLGKTTGGEEFPNFLEAANRYRWLIEQVAPKL